MMIGCMKRVGAAAALTVALASFAGARADESGDANAILKDHRRLQYGHRGRDL